MNQHQFCEYCHGDTKMDDRGNCIACGAPKKWVTHPLLVNQPPLISRDESRRWLTASTTQWDQDLVILK